MVATFTVKPTALRVAYDRPVDVLHVAVGAAEAYEGEGRPKGVELDYSIDSGRPCGAKVIGFKRNGWTDKVSVLADELSKHLAVERGRVVDAIKRAIREG